MKTIKPIRANWEITNQCNLRCRHCYFFNKEDHKEKKPLSPREAGRVLKKLIKAGIFELSIGGGEPFIFEGIKNILSQATKRMQVIVSSNGLLIDDALISFLSCLNNFTLQISLDGAPEFHRYLRNISPGNFRKLDSNIKKCARRLDLQIGFMLCHENVKDVGSILDYCRENGIKKIAVLPYIGKKDDFLLTAKDKKAALKKFAAASKEINVYIRDPEMNSFVSRREVICEAGLTTFNIDCYGKVSACSYLDNCDLDKNILSLAVETISKLFRGRLNNCDRTICLACQKQTTSAR